MEQAELETLEDSNVQDEDLIRCNKVLPKLSKSDGVSDLLDWERLE